MATTTITNFCRRDWLSGNVFNMSTDDIKAALYNGSGHDANTNAYTAVSEAAGAGYTAGGQSLTGISENLDTTNNVAFLDFDDVSWSSSTITATDILFYNDTVTTPTANVSIYVGDFAGSKSSSAGTFQVVMPGAAYNTAVIRIA